MLTIEKKQNKRWTLSLKQVEIKLHQPLGGRNYKVLEYVCELGVDPHQHLKWQKKKKKKERKKKGQEHSVESLPFLRPSQPLIVKSKLQFWGNSNTDQILDSIKALVSILLDVIMVVTQ